MGGFVLRIKHKCTINVSERKQKSDEHSVPLLVIPVKNNVSWGLIAQKCQKIRQFSSGKAFLANFLRIMLAGVFNFASVKKQRHVLYKLTQ